MSEYEILDIYYTANDHLATYIMNFVSILSGYLLATYFLGVRLSRTQFLILTVSYIAIMIITIQGIYARSLELMGIVGQVYDLDLEWWASFHTDATAVYILIGVHFLTLAGSIYFGYSSVKKGES